MEELVIVSVPSPPDRQAQGQIRVLLPLLHKNCKSHIQSTTDSHPANGHIAATTTTLIPLAVSSPSLCRLVQIGSRLGSN